MTETKKYIVKTRPEALQTNADNTLSGSLQFRQALNNLLGISYGGDRNLYQALGYPQNILFEQYWQQYKRQDIAGAIINKPVNATWRGDIVLSEKGNEEDDEPITLQWAELMRDLNLKNVFIRADKLSSIGRYGVLLLGFSDVGKKEDYALPVARNAKLTLKYVAPYTEEVALINSFNEDVTSNRYGKPEYYDITVGETKSHTSPNGGVSASTSKTFVLKVHYTRIIHITGETLDSDVYGEPTLQRVWNRLMDLEKLMGGSAEMFWRGARPGYSAEVDKDYSAGTGLKESLDTQFDEYENNLRRVFVNEGIKMNALTPQVSDPAGHVDIQIQMISCITEIPKRMLTGSERGELASSQDTDQWLLKVASRREEMAENQILHPFIDRLIEYGILKIEKGKYTVEWEPLFSVSEKDKAEVGKMRAEALRSYVGAIGAQEVMPPEMFMKFMLGLPREAVSEINNMIEAAALDIIPNEEEIIEPKTVLKGKDLVNVVKEEKK